jgi:hypothetical protein
MTDHRNDDIWGKVYRKNTDVVARKIAGELFLVPIRGKMADMKEIFALNSVAEYVWKELSDKKLLDIRREVINRFDVEEEQAETDIHEFIEELLAAELIREQ